MADDKRSLGGRSYGGPNKYIQRAGEIGRLGEHVAHLGSRAFLLADPFVLTRYGDILTATMEASGLTYQIERFNGECSSAEIDRVTGLVRASGAQVVVGIGGGKTADTAKMSAIATKPGSSSSRPSPPPMRRAALSRFDIPRTGSIRRHIRSVAIRIW